MPPFLFPFLRGFWWLMRDCIACRDLGPEFVSGKARYDIDRECRALGGQASLREEGDQDTNRSLVRFVSPPCPASLPIHMNCQLTRAALQLQADQVQPPPRTIGRLLEARRGGYELATPATFSLCCAPRRVACGTYRARTTGLGTRREHHWILRPRSQ